MFQSIFDKISTEVKKCHSQDPIHYLSKIQISVGILYFIWQPCILRSAPITEESLFPGDAVLCLVITSPPPHPVTMRVRSDTKRE